MTYQSVTPTSNDSLETFEDLRNAQSEIALQTAASGSKTWRHKTLAQRVDVAAFAAAIMRARVDEFARPVMAEMGKDIDEARREVLFGAEIIDFCAESSGRSLAPEDIKPDSRQEAAGRRPVLFCVQARNCSYDQLARFAAPNLVAGNVVMVKHAESVPESAIAFEMLWLEAGAPLGAFTNLLIADD